ncbi:Ig-like domain repeat protein [Nocardioides sp.]|uniref:Ig-like domain repeat protein n=1 Tax=Nocardioides sp. TaxID=35761 RepID=UPI0027270D62|nr:Ig-like domain repeat protein [Nocardioides sp.]MDO9456735.1 Ig-like domain repeat protein [Nocardioides sp.]
MLVAAATPVVLTATSVPAHAAPQQVSGATFTWGLNGYAQKGVFGPWRLPASTGNATPLLGTTSNGSQSEYAALPGDTSMPASSPQRTPNAVKFVLGTGTADPATGAMTLAWSGSYTVNAYPASYHAPDEIYADPRLTTAADGSGALTLDVTIGAGVDIDGNPSPARHLGRLTVLSFGAGADVVSGDTFRLTPAYQGVTVTEDPAQATCSGTWGSWPAAFVNAMPASVSPHFYSSSCGGLNDNKPPLPVDVDLGLTGQIATTTAVSAPSTRFGQVATATVTVSGTTTGTVAVRSGSTELGRAILTDGRATVALGRRAVGRHPLTATYFGGVATTPSTGATTLVVAKAASATALAVVTKPTRTRAGSARVTVTSPTTTPTGRATIRVGKGAQVVRTLTGALRSGRATVVVPRLAKGRYQLVASPPPPGPPPSWWPERGLLSAPCRGSAPAPSRSIVSRCTSASSTPWRCC